MVAARNVWHESLAVFAMVVLTAYAVGLILTLVTREAELQGMSWTAGLAIGLLTLVVGLGFALRRMTSVDPVS